MSNLDAAAESMGLPVPILPPKIRVFSTRDGIGLSARDWGGDGIPVLFLHGGGLAGYTWDMVCSRLRDNMHCMALDLRGHGDSGWSDEYSIPLHVQDIRQVIRQQGWDAVHLVGMSLGGVVAAYAALENSDFDVLSLTLVDVAPGVSFENTERLREFMRSSCVSEGAQALLAQARTMGARGSDELLLYRYNSLIVQNPDNSWRWKCDYRRKVNYEHIFSFIEGMYVRAHEMKWPCLVVRGGQSRILSDEAAEAFAAMCPDGKVCVVENAGHSVQEDNPRGLATALREFWKLDE